MVSRAATWHARRGSIAAGLVAATLAFGALLLTPGGLAAAPAAPAAPAASGTTITVFAAASLAEAFADLGHRFEQQHPGAHARFSFAGSQQLAAQLAQGARADVFASADTRWMDDAERRGLLAEPPRRFARNRLVLIVPATNPARIARLDQLGRMGIKLVLGADQVPVGRYSRQVIERIGTSLNDPDFSARVYANRVSEEDNVLGVVGKVQLGEADAGMVYRSDINPAVARYVHVIVIPDSLNVLASYPLAVLRGAYRPDLARAFADLVCSREGQQVLVRYKFIAASDQP